MEGCWQKALLAEGSAGRRLCWQKALGLRGEPLLLQVPLVPCSELEQKLMLRDGQAGALGDSGRLAVTVRGDESDEQLATLCARAAEVSPHHAP